jgi:hypothetical protein
MYQSLADFIKKIIQKGYNRLHRMRFRKYYENKINDITQAIGDVKSYDTSKHVDLWQQLTKPINPQWYNVYSTVSNIEDVEYVPEDLYYTIIEPCLNRYELGITTKDKNLCDKYFSNLNFPETLLRNMDGQYYSKDYQWMSKQKAEDEIKQQRINHDKIIAKPSLQSGGGREIHLFETSKDKINVSILEQLFVKDFIVQEYIYQAPYFNQFNPSSLNCIRINTYRSLQNNSIYTDEILLKVGAEGAIIDNTHSGGVYLMVSPDGTLGDFAVDGMGIKYYSPPGTDKPYKEFPKVPFLEEVISAAKEIARQHYYHRCLGVDICVDQNEEVRVIEINNNSIGIGGQMLNGSLFKGYTSEIIGIVKENMKSLNYPIRLE